MLNRRMIGNTLRPLNFLVKVGDEPLDLTSYVVKFRMEGEQSGTSKVAESTTGITKQPTQSVTLASTGLAYCRSHGIKEGQQVVFSTSGSLSGTGITAATPLFAVNVTPHYFGAATVPGGLSIIAGAGTGSHEFYIVGSVQKVFLAADVDTEGRYSAWVSAYSGTDLASVPVAREGMTVEIYSYGAA